MIAKGARLYYIRQRRWYEWWDTYVEADFEDVREWLGQQQFFITRHSDL